MFNTKGIGAVVAVVLFISVTVIAVTGFQTWYQGFQSEKLVDVQEKSDSGGVGSRIETVTGSFLYFNYDGTATDVNYSQIKIGTVTCTPSGTLTSGVNAINLTDCNANVSSGNHHVSILTDNGVFTKKVKFEDDVELPVTSTSFSATGGTITTNGSYTIHTFTSNGTFIVSNENNTVDILIVAGGGSGGSDHGGAGGGGGGGLIYRNSHPITPQTYPIVVGSGGAAVYGTVTSNLDAGMNGENSIFDNYTAIGGGGGGNWSQDGYNGGSGGGGAYYTTSSSPGSGTLGQGNSGGLGHPGSLNEAGGGGGGAGSVGNAGVANIGGNGGIGLSYNISGTTTYYAGGGGGGINSVSTTVGSGGLGGGGAGGQRGATNGTSGTANTGGGGGGAGASGTWSGAGGSGIVIISYLT